MNNENDRGGPHADHLLIALYRGELKTLAEGGDAHIPPQLELAAWAAMRRVNAAALTWWVDAQKLLEGDR